MAGDDIKTLQENMGHYSAAFTLDRYGHVTDTMRRESANRMQAFIRKHVMIGYRLGKVWVFPRIKKSEPLISQGFCGAGNRT